MPDENNAEMAQYAWIPTVLKWVGGTGVATVILLIVLPRHLDLLEALQQTMSASASQSAAQTEVLRSMDATLQRQASDQRVVVTALESIDRQLRDQTVKLDRLHTEKGS